MAQLTPVVAGVVGAIKREPVVLAGAVTELPAVAPDNQAVRIQVVAVVLALRGELPDLVGLVLRLSRIQIRTQSRTLLVHRLIPFQAEGACTRSPATERSQFRHRDKHGALCKT
jgi:hypothetical protein